MKALWFSEELQHSQATRQSGQPAAGHLAKLNAPGTQWAGALEQLGSNALPPIAPPSHKSSDAERALLSAG